MYHEAIDDEALAGIDVGTLRRRLGVTTTETHRASGADVVLFVLWGAIGVAWHAMFGVLGIAAVVVLVRWLHVI